MDIERISRQLDFIAEIDKLKQVYRNTILMDASRKENDAEHTWHMAVCAMLFMEYSDEKDLDMLKVLKMTLLHDIIEIDAGDTYAYDEKGYMDKAEREHKAAERIFGLLPPDQETEFKKLWEEFDERVSPESRYAAAIDTFMPMYHNYKTKGLQWQRLNTGSDKVHRRSRDFIKEGSEELFEFMESLIDDAVNKGYLKK